jgi:hypothetical protein
MDIVPYIMEAYESVFGEECPGFLIESVHTARAVEVRKLYNEAMAAVKEWVSMAIEKANSGKRPLGIGLMDDSDSSAWIPVGTDFFVVLKLRNPAAKDGRDYSYFDRSTDSVYVDIYDEVKDFLYAGGMNGKIFLMRNEMDAGRCTFSKCILDGIDQLCMTPTFRSTLMHELTHLVQNRGGEMFDHKEHLEKIGIPGDSYDAFKQHELFPWEIDADVHGNIEDIVKSNLRCTATEMAKLIYNRFVRYMERHGYDDRDRKRQLWETAVSLARAVKLASERDDVDEEDVDSVIAHIDDYAV